MSSPQESDPPNSNCYNRKDKSLGVLCTKYSLSLSLSLHVYVCIRFLVGIGFLSSKTVDFLSSFLKLYDRDGVDSIGLDDAANRLGLISNFFSWLFFAQFFVIYCVY